MLEHEPQETTAAQTPAAQVPAAQRRVSAEELTRAVSALEEAKAAEVRAGVAPIGQVVEELGLDSTPEEIWAEVQKQRAQTAAKAQVKEQAQSMPMISAAQSAKVGRRVRRGWRGMRGWVWILFWCTGGFGLLSGLPHLLNPQSSPAISGQTITLNSDFIRQTINAQGKDVIVNGDIDTITLKGTARSVQINGDFDTLTGDAPQSYSINGDRGILRWNSPVKKAAP